MLHSSVKAEWIIIMFMQRAALDTWSHGPTPSVSVPWGNHLSASGVHQRYISKRGRSLHKLQAHTHTQSDHLCSLPSPVSTYVVRSAERAPSNPVSGRREAKGEGAWGTADVCVRGASRDVKTRINLGGGGVCRTQRLKPSCTSWSPEVYVRLECPSLQPLIQYIVGWPLPSHFK